jgi:hypothetical protein
MTGTRPRATDGHDESALPPINVNLYAALASLRHAYDSAHEAHAAPWDLALEIGKLQRRAAGVAALADVSIQRHTAAGPLPFVGAAGTTLPTNRFLLNAEIVHALFFPEVVVVGPAAEADRDAHGATPGVAQPGDFPAAGAAAGGSHHAQHADRHQPAR